MNDLFLRFSIIFGGLWTYGLKSEAEILSKKIEWYVPLSIFNSEIIRKVVDHCKIKFDQPPSIKQFFDLCKAEEARNAPFNSAEVAIEYKSEPPDPKVAAYMAKNPLPPDDPFVLLPKKYNGRELGIMLLSEIKKRLRGKML